MKTKEPLKVLAIAALILAGSLLATARIAAAADGAELVAERRCYTCHQMDAMLLGPSYRAIAARHAPRKDVMLPVLAQKILTGGGGNWGVVPMVPSQHVSPDEAEAMAAWILDLSAN